MRTLGPQGELQIADTKLGALDVTFIVVGVIGLSPALPAYFSQARGEASAWEVLDLQPEARGYSPVINARWAYLSVGRRGEIGVDIDWVEFVR